ncbi:MAG: hypothetical protein HYS80_01685 [Candidatus Aenigmarchaeota archaeon]|nr:hypothetical protein [Candidatus Aenigmarchaeota archaeon]
MKLRKELMLLSVISIVFLAGCAGGGKETPAANGVVITSFAPDVTTTEGNLPVTFVLGLKNVGEKAAADVRAQFFGLSDKWTTFSPDRDKFKDVTSSLAPADPSASLPGEEVSFTWSANSAPGTTSDVTYDADVRVAYTYSTSGTAIFRVVDANYLRTNPNVVRGLVSSDATGGPLVVTSTVRSPVVSGTKIARIQFEIQNVGGGKVLADPPALDATSIDAAKLDTLKKITIEATGIKSCAGTPAAAGKVELSTNSPEIIIVTKEQQGKDRKVYAKGKFNKGISMI